jgi:hypothetical protein
MSASSGSVEIVEGTKPDVIDLSIDESESIFMDDVADQTKQADSQAKADAEAEAEARRSGKSVKRKKTDEAKKSESHRGPPGPDPDKSRRLV